MAAPCQAGALELAVSSVCVDISRSLGITAARPVSPSRAYSESSSTCRVAFIFISGVQAILGLGFGWGFRSECVADACRDSDGITVDALCMRAESNLPFKSNETKQIHFFRTLSHIAFPERFPRTL